MNRRQFLTNSALLGTITPVRPSALPAQTDPSRRAGFRDRSIAPGVEMGSLPAHARVRLSIQTESGKSTGARLRVTDASGNYYAPLGHLHMPIPALVTAVDIIAGDDKETPLELCALVHDGAEIDLAPGRYTFSIRKGFEYDPVSQVVEIESGEPRVVSFRLKKFKDMERESWYAGDTHVHFPDPLGIRYVMECEDLRVVSIMFFKGGIEDALKPEDGYFVNMEFFTGKLSPASDGEHFIKVGEEFRHHGLGHLLLQNLKSIVWPVSAGGLGEASTGYPNWPLLCDVAEEAHKQGGLVSWAHWPYPSMEAVIDVALGQIDSIELLTVGDPFAKTPLLEDMYKMDDLFSYELTPIEMYYQFLNCGFKVPVSSGSDKIADRYVLNRPIGSTRTYVKPEGPLSYDSWIEGIRNGRTFISSQPLLELAVDGHGPGETVGPVVGGKGVRALARAASLESYDSLELVYNGKVVRHAAPSGEKFEATIDDSLDTPTGGWIAARVRGSRMLPYGTTYWKVPVFAHTSPVYLSSSSTNAAAPATAASLLDRVSRFESWAESKGRFPTAADKTETLQRIAEAKSVYNKIVRSG